MTYKELKDLLISHKQVFITGGGGVGKSYTLKKLIKMFDNPIVVSSTNSSAMLIGGDTLHKVFKLGIANSPASLQAEDNRYFEWFLNTITNNMEVAKKARLRDLIRLITICDLLVIDEVSMVSAQILDLIFYRLNQIQRDAPPILFTGDLYQIPPISTKDSMQTMIFNSKRFTPKIIELTKIQRTKDLKFAKALQNIRIGNIDNATKHIINEILNNKQCEDATILTSLRQRAQDINKYHLDKIQSREWNYKAIITTDASDNDKIMREIQADFLLTIKEGARVVFCVSDKQQGYYNGLQGFVTQCQDDCIKVLADDGAEYVVLRRAFQKQIVRERNNRLRYEVIFEMWQFPLKVAYAITIHKSQGMSLDSVHIDCEGIFEAGQFYTAISRAINPNKLSISNFKKNFVVANAEVVSWQKANEHLFKKLEYIQDDSLML